MHDVKYLFLVKTLGYLSSIHQEKTITLASIRYKAGNSFMMVYGPMIGGAAKEWKSKEK